MLPIPIAMPSKNVPHYIALMSDIVAAAKANVELAVRCSLHELAAQQVKCAQRMLRNVATFLAFAEAVERNLATPKIDSFLARLAAANDRCGTKTVDEVLKEYNRWIRQHSTEITSEVKLDSANRTLVLNAISELPRYLRF